MGPAILESLRAAADSIGTEVRADSVYFAQTGEKVEHWNADGRYLARDVVVHVSGPAVVQRLDSLEAAFNEMKVLHARNTDEMKVLHARNIDEMKVLHARNVDELNLTIARSNVLRVRNTATQILLAADGNQLMKTKCTRFKAHGESDKSVVDAAAALDVTAKVFVSNADKTVTGRNRVLHFGNLEELDQEVAEVAGMITPALQGLAKWECSVVLKYNDIKKAFHTCFQDLKQGR